MKTKHTAQSAPAYNLRTLTGLIPVAALVFLAFFAAANPLTRVEAGRAGGVTRQHPLELRHKALSRVRTFSKAPPRRVE